MPSCGEAVSNVHKKNLDHLERQSDIEHVCARTQSGAHSIMNCVCVCGGGYDTHTHTHTNIYPFFFLSVKNSQGRSKELFKHLLRHLKNLVHKGAEFKIWNLNLT